MSEKSSVRYFAPRERCRATGLPLRGYNFLYEIKIHAQRCTVQLFGCKSWGDVGSWVWKVRTGPGTVSDSHTMYGLACGNLYHTWAEGEGYNSGGRFYYGSAWSSNEVQYNC